MKKQKQNSKIRQWLVLTGCCLMGVLHSGRTEPVEASMLGGPSHIGTFEGGTTFTTSSSNGINPGLYLEVLDEYGNYHEYISEEGIITVPNTREGAYVTQAKLLGKTKYRDQDTGELLDQWEAGRKLTLESVEEPGLKTTGRNLFDIEKAGLYDSSNYDDSYNAYGYWSFKINLKPNTTYTFSRKNRDGYGLNVYLKIGVENDYKTARWFVAHHSVNENKQSTTITTNSTGNVYLFLNNDMNLIRKVLELCEFIQIEEGSTATAYQPYQSNLLTVNEEVELRGIGNVQDELNLLTGEYVRRIGEVVLDGSEGWSLHSLTNEGYLVGVLWSGVKDVKKSTSNTISDKLIRRQSTRHNHVFYFTDSILLITFDKESVSSMDLKGLTDKLKTLKPTIYYELATESIKTVTLNSTYHFKPVKTRAVYVDGTVIPLVCSVTVPTEPLSFVLNPNEEPGKQFVAPEFTIENNNPASLSVSLKEFKQVTTVFNDVLPNQHQDWSQLDQEQSKDLALALVPKVSDGWKQLNEGPRYVADSSNNEIGEIKPKSNVDFTFSASHGPAFTQALSPRYRLVFVFDF